MHLSVGRAHKPIAILLGRVRVGLVLQPIAVHRDRVVVDELSVIWAHRPLTWHREHVMVRPVYLPGETEEVVLSIVMHHLRVRVERAQQPSEDTNVALSNAGRRAHVWNFWTRHTIDEPVYFPSCRRRQASFIGASARGLRLSVGVSSLLFLVDDLVPH